MYELGWHVRCLQALEVTMTGVQAVTWKYSSTLRSTLVNKSARYCLSVGGGGGGWLRPSRNQSTQLQLNPA